MVTTETIRHLLFHKCIFSLLTRREGVDQCLCRSGSQTGRRRLTEIPSRSPSFALRPAPAGHCSSIVVPLVVSSPSTQPWVSKPPGERTRASSDRTRAPGQQPDRTSRKEREWEGKEGRLMSARSMCCLSCLLQPRVQQHSRSDPQVRPDDVPPVLPRVRQRHRIQKGQPQGAERQTAGDEGTSDDACEEKAAVGRKHHRSTSHARCSTVFLASSPPRLAHPAANLRANSTGDWCSLHLGTCWMLTRARMCFCSSSSDKCIVAAAAATLG